MLTTVLLCSTTTTRRRAPSATGTRPTRPSCPHQTQPPTPKQPLRNVSIENNRTTNETMKIYIGHWLYKKRQCIWKIGFLFLVSDSDADSGYKYYPNYYVHGQDEQNAQYNFIPPVQIYLKHLSFSCRPVVTLPLNKKLIFETFFVWGHVILYFHIYLDS